MKLIKNKNILFFLLLSTILISFTIANNNSLENLETKIENKKELLLSGLNNYKNNLNNFFSEKINPLKNDINYNTIKCLGIITDTNINLKIKKQYDSLKKNILNKYISLNSDIFNINNQKKVGLISNELYNLEMSRLNSEIENYYNLHKELINNYYNNKKQAIEDYQSKSQKYIKNNEDLLKGFNNQINKINSIINKHKIIKEGLWDINNNLGINYEELSKILQKVIKKKNEDFKKDLNYIILSYNISPDSKLFEEIKNYQKDLIKVFQIDLNNHLSNIYGDRYDHQEYNYINEQVDLLKNKFYTNNTLSCEKLIQSNIDLDGYIKNLESKIEKYIKNIDFGLKIITNNSGYLNKNKLTENFISNTNSIYKNKKNQFKKYIEEKIQLRKDKTETEKNKSNKIGSSNQTEKQKNIDISKQKFTYAFKKGTQLEHIKILQKLLKKLGHYEGNINGIFDTKTINAIYQFQLKKGLLKGYENKPSVRGYMGPSTQKHLNLELEKNYDKIFTVQAKQKINNNYKIPSTKIEKKDKFIKMLHKLEKKYDNKNKFLSILQIGLINVNNKLDQPNITTSEKILFEKIRFAIQRYLNE